MITRLGFKNRNSNEALPLCRFSLLSDIFVTFGNEVEVSGIDRGGRIPRNCEVQVNLTVERKHVR